MIVYHLTKPSGLIDLFWFQLSKVKSKPNTTMSPRFPHIGLKNVLLFTIKFAIFFSNFFQKISAFQEKRCHRNKLSHWTLVEPFFKQAHQQCWNIQAQNWRSKMFKEGQRIKNILDEDPEYFWIVLNFLRKGNFFYFSSYFNGSSTRQRTMRSRCLWRTRFWRAWWNILHSKT